MRGFTVLQIQHHKEQAYHVYPLVFWKENNKKKKVMKQNYIELYSKRIFCRKGTFKGTWWLLDGWQKFEQV